MRLPLAGNVLVDTQIVEAGEQMGRGQISVDIGGRSMTFQAPRPLTVAAAALLYQRADLWVHEGRVTRIAASGTWFAESLRQGPTPEESRG